MDSIKLENSHLVQVNTSTRSIWRGNEESEIVLNVKVDKRFLPSKDTATKSTTTATTANIPKKQSSSSDNDDNHNNSNHCCYRLFAYIENYKTKDMHFNQMNGVKLKFKNNTDNTDQASIGIKAKELYHTLFVSIHKNSFIDGDELRVIVEAIPLFPNRSQVIFGSSHPISYVKG